MQAGNQMLLICDLRKGLEVLSFFQKETAISGQGCPEKAKSSLDGKFSPVACQDKIRNENE